MDMVNTPSNALEYVIRGPYWEEMRPGLRFRTPRRTITEADLVNFVSASGMTHFIFVDAEEQGAIGGRAVPAALVFSYIEGMQTQTIVAGTALAMLEVAIKILAPVRVGDTISAIVEIKDIRPTSKGGRAVVTSTATVVNQNEETVFEYTIKRLVAGRGEPTRAVALAAALTS